MPEQADQVTILHEYRYTTYPAPGQPVVMVATTYQKGLLPPRTVYIAEKDLNDSTLRAAIKADMEQASSQAPRHLNL